MKHWASVWVFATKSKQRLFEIKATIALPFHSFCSMTATKSAKNVLLTYLEFLLCLLTGCFFHFLVSVAYVVVLRSLVALPRKTILDMRQLCLKNGRFDEKRAKKSTSAGAHTETYTPPYDWYISSQWLNMWWFKRNTPSYVWYVTSQCWNIRWNTLSCDLYISWRCLNIRWNTPYCVWYTVKFRKKAPPNISPPNR